MYDPNFFAASAWQTNFYLQYRQQHAAMTQWMQQVHHYMDNQNQNIYYEDNQYEQYPNHSHRHYESSVSTAVSYRESDDDEDSIESSDDESGCEYELNVDAILAMRAAKEELKNQQSSASEESFVVVDDEKEEYEYIEFGSLRHYRASNSKSVGERNVNKDHIIEKKIMEELYGEKANTIAGLETAMSITFESLYDKHQSPLWPVLPVCLKLNLPC